MKGLKMTTLLTIDCIYLPIRLRNQAKRFLESDSQYCANLIQNLIGLESPSISLPEWVTTVISGADQRYSPNCAELNFFLTVNPGVGEIEQGVDWLSSELRKVFPVLKSIDFSLNYKSGIHHAHWNRIYRRRD
jgi:hypothetical protein